MRTLEQPVFQNVVAGGTAIIPAMDLGMTFAGLILECGGTTMDNTKINEVIMTVDGIDIFKLKGSELLAINKFYNETANAQYLYIPFVDEEARTLDGELLGGLDTSIRRRISLKVEIDATAVAPTLTCIANVLPPKVDPATGASRPDRAWFKTFVQADHAPASGGQKQLIIPHGATGNLIKAVHLFHSNITEVNVKRDTVALLDDGRVAAMQYVQNRRKRTTQSGHFAVDFTLLNNQSDAVPTVKLDGKTPSNFRYDVVLSAADTIQSQTEVYTTIENLG